MPVRFADGGAVPVRGTIHRLRFVAPRAHVGVVRLLNANVAADASGPGLPVIEISGHGEHAPRRLKNWLEGEARKRYMEQAQLDWSAMPSLLAAACVGFILADIVLVIFVGAGWVRRIYARYDLWIARASGLIFIGFGLHALSEAIPGLAGRRH